MGYSSALGRLVSLLVLAGLGALIACCAGAQSYAQTDNNLQSTVAILVANERAAYEHRPLYLYLSNERSDRTSDHLWTERVAETPQGKLRYLISEDGKTLSENRRRQEIARLKAIAADPRSFIRHEQAGKSDEQHVQQMFNLMPRAFLFQDGGRDGPWQRINFHPNPVYVPQTYEERVLHGMSGTMLIDGHAARLHYLEGRLTDDVTFGYGLLATIRSGSRFGITRDPVASGTWKTTSIDTQINGRVIFLKTLSRQQKAEHRDFEPLAAGLSIQQAVDILTR